MFALNLFQFSCSVCLLLIILPGEDLLHRSCTCSELIIMFWIIFVSDNKQHSILK